MALPGKRNLREALDIHGGNITATAAHFNVTRKTIYNWVQRYELWDDVRSNRKFVSEIAESNIVNAIIGGDVAISQWWLRHVNSDTFNPQTHDQSLALNGATLQALAAMGIDVSEAVRQFEALVQARAAALIEGGADE